MIDILLLYLKLGFWHVIDWEGLDHFYFIVTLAMPFTFLKIRLDNKFISEISALKKLIPFAARKLLI